jgi:hypothetical protein
MEEYANYVADFPLRCSELLDKLMASAEGEGREVTFLLATGCAGLIIPYERLRLAGQAVMREAHPAGDREKFEVLADAVDELEASRFLGSSLWPEDAGSWVRGEVDAPWGWPEQWPPSKILGPDKRTKRVITTIRNALAHGNIASRGNPIDVLFFLSSISARRFEYIGVSPNDFKTLLDNWFKFLSQHPLFGFPVYDTDRPVNV